MLLYEGPIVTSQVCVLLFQAPFHLVTTFPHFPVSLPLLGHLRLSIDSHLSVEPSP